MSGLKQRIVVLISGSGSNLQAIINACQENRINADIVSVISNRADAYGLNRAAQAGIETHLLDHKGFATREAFDASLQQLIDQYQPDWLVLAGFMRILSADFVAHYLGRMINIHPSLLPDYPGLNTHQRVLDAKEPLHGASVHFVIPELDAGPVILQGSLKTREAEDPDQLATRVLTIEHQLYPHALQLLASGRMIFRDNIAYFDNEPLPPNGHQIEY